MKDMLSLLNSSLPHFAYVDGGTGSIVIQAALAACFAAAYGFRGAVSRIISVVRRTDRSKTIDAS
jgi:hypothetical protein